MAANSCLLEQLEPRILLDANPICGAAQFTSASNLETRITAEAHADAPAVPADLVYDPALEINAIFHDAKPLHASSLAQEPESTQNETSSSQYEKESVVVSPGEVLKGSGNLAEHLENHGTVSPGNSPGIQNFATFTQDADGSTEIEIAGTGGPGAPNGHDQINVAGLAQLDGQLKITLLNGFVPSAGQTFNIFNWGSHTGEFADYLGTATIPGHPELAFKPVYSATGLDLQVVTVPVISSTAESVINTGLNTLSQVTTALNSISALAQSLPLIGDSIGDVANMGTAFTNVIADKVNALIALFPRESAVANLIQGWNGTSAAGFTITVKGVLGHYGATAADPFSYDVHLVLTPTVVNDALQSAANAVFGAVFGGSPSVGVHGELDLKFSFGYDSNFWVGIDHLTASVSVNASGTGGGNFNFSPPGSPVSLALGNWSVDLEASVTATPDASVLTGGHILAGTLSDIATGTIPVQDAFNLEKAGTLDATFALVGAFNALGISASSINTVRVQSANIFSGDDPDVTLEVNGSINVFNQALSGDFIFHKTATETTISASNVSLDLKAGTGAGAKRILHAENGSGEFVLIDGKLAGTASLTITQGPEIPNIAITGTTLSLALNATNTAVSTINGTTVDLPAGNYFRLSGNTTVTLTVPSVSISGNFSFESFDPTPAAPTSGDEIVSVGGTDLSFDLLAGSVAALHATNVSGAFLINPQGLAGVARGDVTLGIPGVDLNGTFDIQLNDRSVAVNQTVKVAGTDKTINVPPGPYIRIEADNAMLRVLGITLNGDFVV
jgi:hypothetical protein